ncbi:MAG: glycosyltransferase [Crocinitomicaceae bacterium]
MVKHVLYLSYDGMTDPLGQSQVLPYIIGLTRAGYTFHLISFEKPDRYEKNRETIELICKSNNIDWRPLFYTKRPPLLSTLWDTFRMYRCVKRLNEQYRLSLIHCRSYISALIGLRLKRKLAIPFLFDMRGFWADERLDGKIWNLKNPVFKTVYNYFKGKELEFFSESDHVVSLTKTGKNEIITWKGLEGIGHKISVIPCCVDTNKFDSKKITETVKQSLCRKLDIKKGQFVMGYVGSIGTWYMLEEMLSFFTRNTKDKERPIFLFVTNENPLLIYTTAKEYGIDKDNVRVVSAMHQEVPSYMTLFTYSIFFILPAYSKKASSPTKQGELMAMGIPIICNDGVGDTGDLVRQYNSGCVVPANEIDTFELGDFSFDKTQTINGANAYFGLDYGVNTYAEIYEKITTHEF